MTHRMRLNVWDAVTLVQVIDVVREVWADALLFGNDIYEHERTTPDTAVFLRIALRHVLVPHKRAL